jgi:hypothetical protein
MSRDALDDAVPVELVVRELPDACVEAAGLGEPALSDCLAAEWGLPLGGDWDAFIDADAHTVAPDGVVVVLGAAAPLVFAVVGTTLILLATPSGRRLMRDLVQVGGRTLRVAFESASQAIVLAAAADAVATAPDDDQWRRQLGAGILASAAALTRVDVQTCSGLAPSPYRGLPRCGPVDPMTQGVLDELSTVWGNQPRGVCSYTGTTVPRAFRDQTNNAFYCYAEDMIGWDSAHLAAEAEAMGPYVLPGMLSHEWAHMMQYKRALFPLLELTGEEEQHADCWSGVFAGLEMARGRLSPADVGTAVAHFCSLGNVDPTDSHGTCRERAGAFASGFGQGILQARLLCGPGALRVFEGTCMDVSAPRAFHPIWRRPAGAVCAGEGAH